MLESLVRKETMSECLVSSDLALVLYSLQQPGLTSGYKRFPLPSPSFVGTSRSLTINHNDWHAILTDRNRIAESFMS